MNEWDETKLDKELEILLDDIPPQDDLEKKIEQSIKKRVRKLVLRTIAVFVAIAAALFLLINPFLNAVFLNPYELNKEPEKKMFHVFRDYWETTTPYTEIASLDVTKRGFARYDLQIQAADHKKPIIYGSPNVELELKFGKYTVKMDPDMSLMHMFGRFNDTWTDKETLLNDIKGLPVSSNLYLSIGAKTPETVENLRKSGVHLEWIQIYQPNVQFQGGLSMWMSAAYDDSDYRDEMTDSELKEVYLSNLKNLLDNEQIWRDFGLFDSHRDYTDTKHVLEETYTDAKNLEKLESKYYCISGNRDEVIKYLESTETVSIHIDKVNLSKWN